MEVKGKVLRVEPTNQISDKFKKREVVITTGDDKYPQTIALQLSQDKVELADSLNSGDDVNFHINLRGREWTSPKDNTTRVFNTLEIWKLDVESSVPEVKEKQTAPALEEDFGGEDLPF